MEEILEFNANDIEMPEKLQLYLSGITHYARTLMQETNATNFETECDFNPKGTDKKFTAKFLLVETTRRKG